MGAGGTPANEDVSSIGSGKTHANIDTWEQATDIDCVTGNISPVGELYDEDYAESVTISGATTDATRYRRLTVAAGERHTGDFPKVDVGAKVTGYIFTDEDYSEIEWMLVEAGGTRSNNASVDVSGGQNVLLRNMIVDVSTSGYYAFWVIPGNGKNVAVENCIGITRRSQATTTVFVSGLNDGIKWRNCTGWGIGANNDEVFYYGESTNCIGIGGGGTNGVFDNPEGAGEDNISSDATAPGADNYHNISAADLFADTTNGAEDLHLKSDITTASGNGTDLSAFFSDDIDDDTRVDWDIGADEYIVVGGFVSQKALIIGGGILGQ